MSEKKNDFSKIIKFTGKYKYIIATVAAGLFLISFPSGGNEEKAEAVGKVVDFDVKDFETRIENALCSCEGVGNVKVILSIDSGTEYVYAKEERQSTKAADDTTRESDSDVKPSIISEGSGRQTPVLIKERYPKFRGAMIICNGADDVKVKMNVTEAVSALTGLSSDRISVVKMK